MAENCSDACGWHVRPVVGGLGWMMPVARNEEVLHNNGWSALQERCWTTKKPHSREGTTGTR